MAGVQRELANRRLILAAIFGVAMVPRLLFLILGRPAFDSHYIQLSSSLLADGTFGADGVPTTGYEPLYPLFLALARVLTGDRTIFVQAIQAAVGAAGVVVAYLLAEALTKRPVAALLCAALQAFYPLLIWHAVIADDSILASTTLLTGVYCFVTAKSAGRAAAAGGWLGLSALTRATCLPVIMLAPMILAGERRHAQALACIAAAAIVVGPWAIRNYRLAGTPLPTRSGVNLYAGNSRYSDALFPDYTPGNLLPLVDAIETRAVSGLPPGPQAEAAGDRAAARAALDEIRQRPLQTLRLKARYLMYVFWPGIVPSHVALNDTSMTISDDGQITVRNSPPRPRLEALAYTLSYCPVLVAAIAGIWSRRRRLRDDRILWVVVATCVAVEVVYFPSTRYSTPMSFVWLFYAAVGLTDVASRLSWGKTLPYNFT